MANFKRAPVPETAPAAPAEDTGGALNAIDTLESIIPGIFALSAGLFAGGILFILLTSSLRRFARWRNGCDWTAANQVHADAGGKDWACRACLAVIPTTNGKAPKGCARRAMMRQQRTVKAS